VAGSGELYLATVKHWQSSQHTSQTILYHFTINRVLDGPIVLWLIYYILGHPHCHNIQTKMNGTILYSRVISLVWVYILKSWKVCNMPYTPQTWNQLSMPGTGISSIADLPANCQGSHHASPWTMPYSQAHPATIHLHHSQVCANQQHIDMQSSSSCALMSTNEDLWHQILFHNTSLTHPHHDSTMQCCLILCFLCPSVSL